MKQFHVYNLEGKAIDKYPPVYYQIENNTLTIQNENGTHKYKIVESNEFVHKFQKTQVKALNGAEGLQKHFDKCNSPDSPFNSWLHNGLQEIA